MVSKSHIHGRHHHFCYSLLDVDCLQKARKAGFEYLMQLICVVQDNQGCIYAFGFEIAEESGSYRSHTLYVAAC
jgi:hypothetical protein